MPKLQYFYRPAITAKMAKRRNCSTFTARQLLQKWQNAEIAVLLLPGNYCKNGRMPKLQYFYCPAITAKMAECRNCSTFTARQLLQKWQNAEIAVLLLSGNYCKNDKTPKLQYFYRPAITAKMAKRRNCSTFTTFRCCLVYRIQAIGKKG